MKTKYSLWFMPEDDVYIYFKEIIEDLAKKHNSPVFKPHITLIGDIVDKDVFAKTEALSKKIKPFTINIIKASYMFDYYRCVLALAEKNTELMNAAKLARELFVDFNEREYIPHLSLLYGDFSEQKKQEIVNELGIMKKEFKVETLKLVTSGNIPEKWTIIKEYSLG